MAEPGDGAVGVAVGEPASGLGARTSSAEVLELVYRYRLLATRQVHALHRPDGSIRSVQRVLSGLASDGLVSSSRVGVTGEAVWWATTAGAASAELGAGPVRRWRASAAKAKGPLRQHTLDINAACIAFVTAVRAEGGESSDVSWEHEVAFRVADTGRSRLLMVDAVLQFMAFWPSGEVEVLDRFIEVDRNTESKGDVISKLRRYVELHRYKPRGSATVGWRSEFERFPGVVVVLCGASEPVLVGRRRKLLQLCEQDLVLAEASGLGSGRRTVGVSFTTLADMMSRGPFEPIFWQPGLAAPVDLVGDALLADDMGSSS